MRSWRRKFRPDQLRIYLLPARGGFECFEEIGRTTCPHCRHAHGKNDSGIVSRRRNVDSRAYSRSEPQAKKFKAHLRWRCCTAPQLPAVVRCDLPQLRECAGRIRQCPLLLVQVRFGRAGAPGYWSSIRRGLPRSSDLINIAYCAFKRPLQVLVHVEGRGGFVRHCGGSLLHSALYGEKEKPTIQVCTQRLD